MGRVPDEAISRSHVKRQTGTQDWEFFLGAGKLLFFTASSSRSLPDECDGQVE